MKQRQLIMLLGALGVLILIAFLSGAFNNDFSEMDVPTFSIVGDEIDQISISSPEEATPILLVKEKEKWIISQPIQGRADSIALTRLTENLDQLTLESVVSTNPERYENYGVTDAAQQVTVTSNGKDQTLYVGKSGPDYSSIYLRVSDDPRVFVTSGRLNAPNDLDAWRDKTIMSLAPSLVARIQVTSPNEAYSVQHLLGGWQLEKDDQNVAADSASVMRWLTRFSTLKGTGFEDAATPSALQAEATHVVTFGLKGGATRTLWLIEQENSLRATTSDQEHAYTLSKGLLTSLVPESSTLTQGQ